jgi:hypothetical protein
MVITNRPIVLVPKLSKILLAVLASCALLCSCAGRRAADYRVVRHGESHYVYPPGLRAVASGPAAEATVEVPVARGEKAGRECAVSAEGFRVEAMQGQGLDARLMARLRLSPAEDGDYEPSMESSVPPRIRSAFETLAEAECLAARSVRSATRRVLENLPLRFNELLPHHYSYFRGGSSIDLSAGSRLKVQEAVFDEAARAAAQQEGSTSPLAGYAGTVTAYYDVLEAGDGSLAMEPAPIESDVPANFPGGARGSIPLALGTLESRYLRLVFLGWLVDGDTERKAVLLASQTSAELERMSHAVLENPVGLCAAAAPDATAACFGFSGRTSTEVEVLVRVNGENRYVLLGTPLKAAAPPAAAVDGAVLARVKLRRRYAGRLVAVRLPARDAEVLELPLLAGDEVEW